MNTNPKTQIIEKLLAAAMGDPPTIERVRADFMKTFLCTGISHNQASTLTQELIELLGGDCPLDIQEQMAYAMFMLTFIEGTKTNMVQALNEAMIGRSEIIYNQISPYLKDVEGPVVDFGCGNGKVAQFLCDRSGLDIVGYDVVAYQMPGVTVPLHIFDGGHVPVEDNFFEAAVVTNVIHHEAENENILRELTRIVRRKLVIIETVPIGATPEEVGHDRLRTFMNDFLYNRLFCYGADIPTPGTYETPQGWIDRFRDYGWRSTVSVDLGVDQKVIEDTHHLLVFEK